MKNAYGRIGQVFSLGAAGSVPVHPRKTRRDLEFLCVVVKLDKHIKRCLAAFGVSVFRQSLNSCTCAFQIYDGSFY